MTDWKLPIESYVVSTTVFLLSKMFEIASASGCCPAEVKVEVFVDGTEADDKTNANAQRT